VHAPLQVKPALCLVVDSGEVELLGAISQGRKEQDKAKRVLALANDGTFWARLKQVGTPTLFSLRGCLAHRELLIGCHGRLRLCVCSALRQG